MPEMTPQERAAALERGRALTPVATEHTADLQAAIGRQIASELMTNSMWDSQARPRPNLDSRTPRIFAPQFDPLRPEESRAQMQAFIDDYTSGDPERRRPHLDRIVAEMSRMQFSNDMLTEQNVLENPERIRMMGQYGCYIENVRADNPEYFSALFDRRPELEHQFDHFQLYSAPLSDFTIGVFQKHAVNLSNAEVYDDPAQVAVGESRIEAVEETLSMIAPEARNAAWRMAAAKREPSPLRLDIRYEDFPMRRTPKTSTVEQLTVSAYDAADDKRRGVLSTHAHDIAYGTDALFPRTQLHLMEQRGLTKYDMLFIAGRPLSQLAAQEGKPFDPQRAEVMLAEALVKGDKPVNAANLVRTAGGQFDVAVASVVGQSIRPEPPAPRYNWFRRTIFNWGPFKLPPPPTPEADHNRAAERTAEENAGPRETQIRDSVRTKAQQQERAPQRSAQQELQRERVSLRDLQPARALETTAPTAAPNERQPAMRTTRQ